MNQRCINKNPIPWKQNDQSRTVKIASLNCMNLKNNYADIACDNTLKESTVIALSETWLNDETHFNIEGYKSHFNSAGQGKGIALFYKETSTKHRAGVAKLCVFHQGVIFF